MNDDIKKLNDLVVLNALLDKDKYEHMKAILFHKKCLKDEKDEEIIRIHREAMYHCIINMCKEIIPDNILKEMDKNFIINCFLYCDENVSYNDTDIKGVLK